MTQRDTNFLRVWTSDDGTPIGVAGLDTVNRAFKTGRFWFVAGDTSFRGRGYSTRAASAVLTLAFRDLGLQAVTSWAVDTDPPILGRHRDAPQFQNHRPTTPLSLHRRPCLRPPVARSPRVRA